MVIRLASTLHITPVPPCLIRYINEAKPKRRIGPGKIDRSLLTNLSCDRWRMPYRMPLSLSFRFFRRLGGSNGFCTCRARITDNQAGGLKSATHDAADGAITAFPKRNASSILSYPVPTRLAYHNRKRRCIPDVCYLRVRLHRLQFEAAYISDLPNMPGVLRGADDEQMPIRLSKLSNSEFPEWPAPTARTFMSTAGSIHETSGKFNTGRMHSTLLSGKSFF